MKLILASQSPYRKIQLEQAGFKFEAHAPRVNEEDLKTRGPKEAKALCEFLARSKATSLKLKFPDSFILGCDQLVDFAGERMDKPGSRQKAIIQLGRMQGRSHKLITSISMVSSLGEKHFTDVTEITLRKLSRPEIEAYVDRDEPYDCAGAYKIEKAGMLLIEKLVSADPSAIQGIPMQGLASLLIAHGITIDKFWVK